MDNEELEKEEFENEIKWLGYICESFNENDDLYCEFEIDSYYSKTVKPNYEMRSIQSIHKRTLLKLIRRYFDRFSRTRPEYIVSKRPKGDGSSNYYIVVSVVQK